MRERLIRGVLAILPLVAITAALAVVAAPASAATTRGSQPEQTVVAGSIGVRLVEVPADAVSDPRAQLYIVDHLAPGTTIHRRIEISNSSATATAVSVYPAAASIANGAFLGADGHTANDLSSWTSVDPATPAIPAGDLTSATVTIAVPSDAAPGEQYAVVWAEVRTVTADGGGVVEVNRVGIRIYLSVGPGGPPPSDFTVDSLIASRSADGQPTVLARVHNTGGRALDLNGTLLLADGPGGLSAGPFPVELGTTVGLGETETVTIALDKQVPAGPWDAQINLRSGLLERQARATITFPDSGTGPAVAARPTARPGWPYLGGAGAAAALLAIAGTLLALRRRRRRPVRRRHAIA